MKVGTNPSTTRRAVRTSTGWHPEDVKAALRKRGITLASLSREHGYHPNAVGMAIHGARSSRPLMRIIARALGVKPSAIWPDRYRRAS